MGMFDEIYSNYPVFGCPYDKELQTKDLENLMLRFTLDPDGQLWEIDTSNTWDMREIPRDQQRKNLPTFEAVANGKRGRVRPFVFTGEALVYPAKYYGNYRRMPCALLTFSDGTLVRLHRDTADGMRNSGRYPMP